MTINPAPPSPAPVTAAPGPLTKVTNRDGLLVMIPPHTLETPQTPAAATMVFDENSPPTTLLDAGLRALGTGNQLVSAKPNYALTAFKRRPSARAVWRRPFSW